MLNVKKASYAQCGIRFQLLPSDNRGSAGMSGGLPEVMEIAAFDRVSRLGLTITVPFEGDCRQNALVLRQLSLPPPID